MSSTDWAERNVWNNRPIEADSQADMFGRAGTELGLIHQVEAGWTTLHTVDVVLEYRNLKYNKIIKKLVFYFFTCGAKWAKA